MPDDHDLLAASDDELAAPPAVEGGVVAGRVTDFDGIPLVGVRVEAAASAGGDLDLLPALSDGDGRFRLEGLADGRYDLRFVLGQVKARVLAVPTGTEDLEARLARPQGILLVTTTPPGSEPPALLHVALDRETDGGLVREHAGRHRAHRLLLWSIRPGRYRVAAWGGPWLPVVAHGVEVRPGEPAPRVDLHLAAKGGRIEGRVLDADGEPVAEALVCWRPLEEPGPWGTRDRALAADEDGRFHVQGLPEGRYRIAAGTPDGPLAQDEIAIDEQAPTALTLTLP